MTLDQLERKLGYEFADQQLLALALSHRSRGDTNNERLEFLGDAALGFVISNWLYHAFPEACERDLTLMRASLVKGESLAEVARDMGLGDYLRLGIGERRGGGHQRASILADALEAVIGAVVRDGGIDAGASLVERLFEPRLRAGELIAEKDAKTRLQEVLQSRHIELPEYRIVNQQGDAHEPVFTVQCAIEALDLAAVASASTRRDAEKAAARILLDRLLQQPAPGGIG